MDAPHRKAVIWREPSRDFDLVWHSLQCNSSQHGSRIYCHRRFSTMHSMVNKAGRPSGHYWDCCSGALYLSQNTEVWKPADFIYRCVSNDHAGRILHSPILVALSLSMGFETWLPVDWHHPPAVDSMRYKVPKRVSKLYISPNFEKKNGGGGGGGDPNTTLSSILLKYRGGNYTNFAETWKSAVKLAENM